LFFSVVDNCTVCSGNGNLKIMIVKYASLDNLK